MQLTDPWTVLTYSLDAYPFPELVAESLMVDDLTRLSADLRLNTWQTDQTSPWHGPFYAGFETWQDTYDEFVRTVIASHIREPFYYQRVPTFRVHLPDNVAVGEFHTDAMYHHPFGEESFWLPLTNAYESCSLMVADDDDELHVVNAHPGQMIRFDAVTRRHGNMINVTGHSRVSFDFRCLLTRLLPTVEGPPTKHTRMRFVPGDYYASEAVG